MAKKLSLIISNSFSLVRLTITGLPKRIFMCCKMIETNENAKNHSHPVFIVLYIVMINNINISDSCFKVVVDLLMWSQTMHRLKS